MQSETTDPDTFEAGEALMTPSEVAKVFRVDPKTVTRWSKRGRLTVVRTLGGHRRFLAREVRQLAKAARENYEIASDLPTPAPTDR